MGSDQWIAISNKNESSAFTLKIQNVKLISGKFYTCDDKDKEIPASDIEGHEIGPRSTFLISSTGLADSPIGTEGSYEVVDQSNGEVLRTVVWNSPGGEEKNLFEVRGSAGDWIVGNLGPAPHGAIGEVFVSFAK